MRRVVPIVRFDKDTTAAEIWGPLEDPIFPLGQSPFAIGTCREIAREAALRYSEDDMLIMEGPAILATLAVKEWVDVHKKAMVLIFHRRERKYLVREIL